MYIQNRRDSSKLKGCIPLKNCNSLISLRHALAYFAYTDKVISVLQKKCDSLYDLKKSILQKAFSGALTSPERTDCVKDGRSPSDRKLTNKNPERVL